MDMFSMSRLMALRLAQVSAPQQEPVSALQPLISPSVGQQLLKIKTSNSINETLKIFS